MEGADDLQRGLGYGLIEVAAGRGDSAADGNGGSSAVVEAHLAGALVERGDDGFEVGREGLFAGDLLQTAAHFAHGLRPAAGGVGQKQHIKTHLPVVFGDGHGGVHRCFTSRHGHGGGVADDDGALHEGAAGAGVDELGELLEDFHHLAGALAAGRHHHHVHGGVLGFHVLQNRLACAEGAGHAEGAALDHRQEGVDAADLGDHGLVGAQPLIVAVHHLLDGPGEDHAQFFRLTQAIFQHRHGVADGVGALGFDGFDHPALILAAEGHHDLVSEETLGHSAQSVASLDAVAHLGHGSKLPGFVGNGVEVDAALQEEAALVCQLRQGVLEAVVDLSQEAGAELHAEKLTGELHPVAHLDAVGHLIDLHAGHAIGDADDLALEPLVSYDDVADFIFLNRAVKLCRNEVAVDAGYNTCYLFHMLLTRL